MERLLPLKIQPSSHSMCRSAYALWKRTTPLKCNKYLCTQGAHLCLPEVNVWLAPLLVSVYAALKPSIAMQGLDATRAGRVGAAGQAGAS